jgi:hypothetical protein
MITPYYKHGDIYLDYIPSNGICISSNETKEEWYHWNFKDSVIHIPQIVYAKLGSVSVYDFAYYVWEKFGITLYPSSPPYLDPITFYTQSHLAHTKQIINTLDYRLSKFNFINQDYYIVDALLKNHVANIKEATNNPYRFWVCLKIGNYCTTSNKLLMFLLGTSPEIKFDSAERYLIDYFTNSPYFNLHITAETKY